MLNNFVNFDFFAPNFQGLILVKNALISQVGMLGAIFIACSKPEAMAIYAVKQACENDKLACGYMTIFSYTANIFIVFFYSFQLCPYFHCNLTVRFTFNPCSKYSRIIVKLIYSFFSVTSTLDCIWQLNVKCTLFSCVQFPL